MQLTSLTSASTARPVKASVESAWRTRGQSESEKSQATPSGGNRQPEIIKATQRQQQFAEDQANNSSKAAASLNEELLQQQQSTGVYTAQIRSSEPMSDSSQLRRKDAVHERRPSQPQSQIAYAAERANRVYLEHASQQTGRMVDELV